MVSFRFEKGANERAKETAVASIVVLALIGLGAFYIAVSGDNATSRVFGKALGWLTLVCGVLLFLWSLLLARKEGRWLIVVTETAVSWEAPAGIGEQSFRMPINEVDRVVCFSATNVEYQSSFCLVTKDKQEIPLKPTHSGVNIHKFIQSLVDLGVAYEEREET